MRSSKPITRSHGQSRPVMPNHAQSRQSRNPTCVALKAKKHAQKSRTVTRSHTQSRNPTCDVLKASHTQSSHRCLAAPSRNHFMLSGDVAVHSIQPSNTTPATQLCVGERQAILRCLPGGGGGAAPPWASPPRQNGVVPPPFSCSSHRCPVASATWREGRADGAGVPGGPGAGA